MQRKSVPEPASMEQMLHSIEERCGVLITVHDLHGKLLLGDEEHSPVIAYGRHVHKFPGCRKIRHWIAGERKCYSDCFIETEEYLKHSCRPFCRVCWRGLAELVVPIVHEDVHELTLMAGMFRDPSFPAGDQPVWFRKLYEALPEIDSGLFAELETLLTAAGNALLSRAFSLDVDPADSRRHSQILKFIRLNMFRKIRLEDLAHSMNLSPSRASAVVRRETGLTFPALLTRERIACASLLLRETDRPISEIAETVGFSNVFYFSRVFSRETSCPPGQYRAGQTEK